jgi:hypothetical protein
MKNTIRIFITFLFLTIITSCKDKNEIRVKSTFSNPVKVVVGPADFGTVKPVSTSEYKTIPTGKHDITGDITGSISITKNKKQKYTININSVGIVTLVDDGK